MIIAERVFIMRIILVGDECIVYWIEPVQATRCGTYPETPTAVFVECSNDLSADPFLLRRTINIMFKGVGGLLEQVKPAGCPYPEMVTLIQVKNVDVIIAQTGRICLVMKKMREFFRTRIITIQTA